MTVKNHCVICEDPVTAANDSAEHIIQNAIGGRRKTRGFICTRCNNTTGVDWDAELAAQLNGFCLFFEIRRERGPVPAKTIETTAGETFRLLPEGGFALVKPTFETNEVEAGTQITIRARNMRGAREMVQGFKRKYPTIDVEAALKNAEPKSTYPEGMILITAQIGGENGGRAIVKSAMAFAHDCGISAAMCEQGLNYLRTADSTPCFGYYQTTDLAFGRPVGVPFHCVAIDGNRTTGLLLAYVEYFGCLRVVICLSKSYAGPAINRCYAINPSTGDELQLSVHFPFVPADIVDIYDYKHSDYAACQREMESVIGPAFERKQRKENGKVAANAMRFAFENCGAKEGELLTDEHRARIARLFAERITPYVANLAKRRLLPKEIITNREAGNAMSGTIRGETSQS